MRSKKLPILAFCFFNAWLLAFAYEGKILYALFDMQALAASSFVRSAMLAHALGLFTCGLFVKTIKCARTVMAVGSILCLLGSGLFFIPVSSVWKISLLGVSFLAGLWNSSWSFFYCSYFSKSERMTTAATAIAGGTSLMVILNFSSDFLNPFIALILAMVCLLAALLCVLSCRTSQLQIQNEPSGKKPYSSTAKLLFLLSAFILTVTVTSGLMFQVVNPAFDKLGLLPTIYWAVPYIAAMILVARLPSRINRSYILYIAVAMIGFGFLAFLTLDRSAITYLLVNTLLLGAFGITDLFWWSILGEMLEIHHNPARVMGIGLSVNVAGVLLGETISSLIGVSADEPPVIVAIASICLAVIILPILFNKLTLQLKNSTFLQTVEEIRPKTQDGPAENLPNLPELTTRELEITGLLLKGYTYRLIAQELFISESTVKTHIQNVYYKMNVRSKAELIQQFKEK